MGRRGGRKVKGKGLFHEPKHKWLADVITIKSIRGARKACKKLLNALDRRKYGRLRIGRKRALQIARSLSEAANRVYSMLKKENLKPRTRKRLEKIGEIYESAADKAYDVYHAKFVRKRR